MKRLQQQKGFTLVELAIVLTIVGLLIGGILKGQALIANAKVTAQMSQFQAIEAATTTFQDTYAGLPGDLPNANTRVPNCATCTNAGTMGSGSGVVGTPNAGVSLVAAAPMTNGMLPANVAFWSELSAAQLISGVSGIIGAAGSQPTSV